MECLVKILLWSTLVIWTTNGQFLSKFSRKEIFFVNLEEGFFGCQVNETTEVLQIFKVEKLCDGKSDCYLGSDENQKELKCSNNCLYTTGHRCINGACLDSQCHCNDGWGGKGCSMPDDNECKYRCSFILKLQTYWYLFSDPATSLRTAPTTLAVMLARAFLVMRETATVVKVRIK